MKLPIDPRYGIRYRIISYTLMRCMLVTIEDVANVIRSPLRILARAIRNFVGALLMDDEIGDSEHWDVLTCDFDLWLLSLAYCFLPNNTFFAQNCGGVRCVVMRNRGTEGRVLRKLPEPRHPELLFLGSLVAELLRFCLSSFGSAPRNTFFGCGGVRCVDVRWGIRLACTS